MRNKIVKGLAAAGFLAGLALGLTPKPAGASQFIICPDPVCMRLFWDGKVTLYQMQNRGAPTPCRLLSGPGMRYFSYPADGAIPGGLCTDF